MNPPMDKSTVDAISVLRDRIEIEKQELHKQYKIAAEIKQKIELLRQTIASLSGKKARKISPPSKPMPTDEDIFRIFPSRFWEWDMQSLIRIVKQALANNGFTTLGVHFRIPRIARRNAGSRKVSS